ncbi:MAG: shikimate kinase [Candidatus Hecatellales archaeon]|nr:MAG: shikimate kinase [Candidatus Hecatellales archaeon]
MKGFGEAVAYGAATIVNAIATGRGAAFGINLKTKARVTLTSDVGVVKGKILSDPKEDTRLIEAAVKVVFKRFGVEKKFGAYVETESNIPIARGLKSSSVASNAIVLATLAALKRKTSDKTVLSLSVKAAFEAKTTVTGAFDDTCASYYGGVVVTDNLKQKILKKDKIKEDYSILIHIPPKKVYTAKSDVEKMRLIAPQVELAFKEALKGKNWEALTLNGILYSSALGYSQETVFEALKAGAVAAGLSGKGPAIVAVVEKEKKDKVLDVWKPFKGEVLETNLNNKKSFVVEAE